VVPQPSPSTTDGSVDLRRTRTPYRTPRVTSTNGGGARRANRVTTAPRAWYLVFWGLPRGVRGHRRNAATRPLTGDPSWHGTPGQQLMKGLGVNARWSGVMTPVLCRACAGAADLSGRRGPCRVPHGRASRVSRDATSPPGPKRWPWLPGPAFRIRDPALHAVNGLTRTRRILRCRSSRRPATCSRTRTPRRPTSPAESTGTVLAHHTRRSRCSRSGGEPSRAALGAVASPRESRAAAGALHAACSRLPLRLGPQHSRADGEPASSTAAAAQMNVG